MAPKDGSDIFHIFLNSNLEIKYIHIVKQALVARQEIFLNSNLEILFTSMKISISYSVYKSTYKRHESI